MSKKKNADNKPVLSPHLQIYKPTLNPILSISHRITGAMLFFALIAICWFVVYFAYFSPQDLKHFAKCDCFGTMIAKILLKIASLFFVFALYYHMCNGIRHFFFDIGKGFDLKTSRISGFAVLISAALLTFFTLNLYVF